MFCFKLCFVLSCVLFQAVFCFMLCFVLSDSYFKFCVTNVESWILSPGSWVLDPQWLLDPGSSVVPGSWSPVFGSWILKTGSWKLVPPWFPKLLWGFEVLNSEPRGEEPDWSLMQSYKDKLAYDPDRGVNPYPDHQATGLWISVPSESPITLQTRVPKIFLRHFQSFRTI